jgi:hypothetical protein
MDMLGMLLRMRAWWYFDSTSFPYQLPWRFSLSIFFDAAGSAGTCATRRCAPGKCVTRVGAHQENAGPCDAHPRHSQMQKAAFGGVAFRLKKNQGFPGFFYFL